MNGKYFLDTNILIYCLEGEKDREKKRRAVWLLGQGAVFSTQIIAESINVMYRKLNYPIPRIRKIIVKFMEAADEIYEITPKTIELALDISEKYGFSFYDSQVIASAEENFCQILYSEDLQHYQLIGSSLRVLNPFTG